MLGFTIVNASNRLRLLCYGKNFTEKVEPSKGLCLLTTIGSDKIIYAISIRTLKIPAYLNIEDLFAKNSEFVSCDQFMHRSSSFNILDGWNTTRAS
jgi:hypothetical protein